MSRLATVVRTAQDEMATAVQRGGLVNDPLRYVLGAVSTGLGAMFQIFAASEQHYRDISGDLDRQTRDVVTRARSEIELAQAQSVQAIAAAIASAADQALTRRVHVLERKLACSAAGVLFGIATVCLGTGFWWGHTSATASIAHTEAGIAAAFRGSADAAKTWLELMQANDVRQELRVCSSGWTDPTTGRRACWLPVWLDPPQNPTPHR